jgi:hypothetical protein
MAVTKRVSGMKDKTTKQYKEVSEKTPIQELKEQVRAHR